MPNDRERETEVGKDTWQEWRREVLNAIERHEKSIDEIKKFQTKMMIGVISVLVGVLIQIIMKYLEQHK